MMDLISQPTCSVQGDIEVPGDKSISHRSIMFGSIATGTTRVRGFLAGEDCLATLKAFEAMGVVINRQETEVVIQGVGKHGLIKPREPIDCGNSGTTMRLLAGLLAAQPFSSCLTGDQSLLKRPMERVARPLRLMGANLKTNAGCPPLDIHGVTHLEGIVYEMPEASAQVKSCLLLAGLYAQGETTIIEPKPTRDHTERMLTAFAYPYRQSGNRIVINAASECRGTEIMVPGDLSSAAFFIIAATLIPIQGGVVESGHDHRVAMAFAIAGAVAKHPVTIKHASSIATSFPTFVDLANQLNMAMLYVQ
jgi:3-phosphoshikimate 1-carboxyvinyltransferase